jgi:hypothetical protein
MLLSWIGRFRLPVLSNLLILELVVVTSMLLGLVCMFFVIGHSTLIYFQQREIAVFPLRRVFFPWPRNGKSVSFLCYILSLLFLVLIFAFPADPLDGSNAKWKILLVFVFLPLSSYLNYLRVRIKKNGEKFYFFSAESTPAELSLPLLVSAALTGVSYFI